jgi:hypothetical protein
VENVVIRRNHFYNIFGPIVRLHPSVDTKRNPKARYHRNIVVEQNTIEASFGTLVHAHAVDGFTFRDNTIRRGLRPEAELEEPNLRFTASSNVSVTRNVSEWDKPLTIATDALTEKPVID